MRDNRHLDELRIIANQRAEERDYWLEKLSGELEKCGFPYDYKKAGDDKPSVDVVSETFPQTLSSALSKLSTGSDVRLHIILVSVLILLLNKYTGKSDIIVGAPILKPDVKADFTNTTIALRTQIKEGMTFKELLFNVRQTCSEAVKNQGYPIEILIDELDLPFVEGNFPLFDTAILVENIHEKRHIRSVTPGMIFSFSRVGENIDCGLEYDSCLYEPSTAGRIMNHFRRLLEAVLTDVEMKIPAVDILSQEEKRQLLYDFNDTAAAYPKDKTIQALFQEQVERNPNNIALIGPANSNLRDKETGSTMKERISLTYDQLSCETDNLAALLVQKGVGPDSIVGLLAERSIEMIIAIFAILKAGGAYLPIEPPGPEARKSYMLKESKTTLLLTTRSLTEEVEKLQALPLETIYIEESNWVGAGLAPALDPTKNYRQLLASDLAYIIYTSGTTGKPKGILT
ncbi:MAG: AMP-binding protein, partial [Candidatus Aminicenantes bacterium]|nr:AMP-binding protein [Candidatus Aminicenantes bacterium]